MAVTCDHEPVHPGDCAAFCLCGKCWIGFLNLVVVQIHVPHFTQEKLRFPVFLNSCTHTHSLLFPLIH